MLSGPSNLQCPACGHVFLSTQTHAEAMETCAHCAFAAPRPRFHALTPSPGAQPVRFQKRAPRLQDPAPLAAAPPPAPPPAQPSHGSHPRHHFPAPPAHWHGPDAARPHGAPPPAQQERVIEPKKTSRVAFWAATALALAALCGVTALLAREKIRERIRGLKAAHAAKLADTAARVSRVPAPAPKADPMADINQRVLTGAAMNDAQRLVEALFKGRTLDERLAAIASPEKHRAEVAALFDGNPSPPLLVALTPITNPPLSLATGRRTPMFKVVTTRNAEGALLQLVAGPSGEQLIHWPLLHETHERLLARYVAGRSRDPQWFSVGLRRCHSFALPAAARAEFDAIDIDGSTDGSGRVVAFVAKNSPLGRHLARRLEWESFYYGRVLLSWMDIVGEARPVLLDCEGSGVPETQ